MFCALYGLVISPCPLWMQRANKNQRVHSALLSFFCVHIMHQANQLMVFTWKEFAAAAGERARRESVKISWFIKVIQAKEKEEEVQPGGARHAIKRKKGGGAVCAARRRARDFVLTLQINYAGGVVCARERRISSLHDLAATVTAHRHFSARKTRPFLDASYFTPGTAPLKQRAPAWNLHPSFNLFEQTLQIIILRSLLV